jgi:hypothetical protein
LSGLPEEDELGASTGACATGAEFELPSVVDPFDFFVPLAEDLAFGPDMAVK